MHRTGSQRSVLSAREHSLNWSGSDSPSTVSESEDDDTLSDEFLTPDGLYGDHPLHPVLVAVLREPTCEPARTLLSIGWYEEALVASYEARDMLISAAGLVLTGNARGALQALEAHIVTSAVVLHEMGFRSRAPISPRVGTVQRCYENVLENWLECRAAGRTELSEAAQLRASQLTHRVVVVWQLQLLDWELWRRWYILALLLITPEETVDELNGDDESPAQSSRAEPSTYVVPNVSWLRCFFGLRDGRYKAKRRGSRDTNNTSKSGTGAAVAALISSYSCEEILAELLSQCCDEEISIITAIAAMCTQRYRSAMTFASRFVESALFSCHGTLPAGANTTAAPSGKKDDRRASASTYVARPDDVVFAHFIRCRCALAVGERTQAVDDMTALMRHSDLMVQVVGCALAVYGMPLPEAEEVVLAYDLARPLSLYAYAVAEYVHALTLLQLGQVEQGLLVAQAAYALSPSKTLADELLLIIMRCATAMEDSTTILRLPLTAHCRIYLAVAPAFFGGLQPAGIRLHVHSSTFRLLYPRQLALQASLRQVLPFHMNRATYFVSQRRFRDAWDDTCCAVAAADELVGSAEFAFTDCFPLQVYLAASLTASRLLTQLVGEQVELILRCAADPDNAALTEEAEAVMAANDEFAREVLRLGAEWTTRARQFFPNSSLVESMQVLWATTANEPRALSRAALVARRFPRTILAQNTFTLALFYGHRVPEAIDAAQKNLQDFPHDAETLLVEQSLKEKNTVYVFSYRAVLPLRYSPANRRRFYTKRMIFATVLLALHVAFACLTLMVNMPQYISFSDATGKLALRLQLPSAVPLFFSGVFFVQALVAAVTPVNLIHTLLSDLQFTDTWLTRLLFGMRGVVYANVVNCIQISAAGNNFLIEEGFFTFIFYFILALLSVPFTTRMWFLPSVDEPKVGLLSWLTMLSVDAVFALITFVPHVILAVIEPISFILFNFFIPAKRPSGEEVSSSIRRRLLYHEHFRYEMPSRYRPGSGSRYVHIRVMGLLFYKTHLPLDTGMLSDAQREEENYRAFPLVDPQLTDRVEGLPLRPMAELLALFGDLLPNYGSSEGDSSSFYSSVSGTRKTHHEKENEDGGGDDDASPSDGVSSEMDEVVTVDSLSRGGGASSFVNPMAQVQKTLDREEERRKTLVRRSASFVLPHNMSHVDSSNDSLDGHRTRQRRRRTTFALAGREAAGSAHVSSRAVPSYGPSQAAAANATRRGFVLDTPPSPALAARGERRGTSQSRPQPPSRDSNATPNRKWENPLLSHMPH